MSDANAISTIKRRLDDARQRHAVMKQRAQMLAAEIEQAVARVNAEAGAVAALENLLTTLTEPAGADDDQAPPTPMPLRAGGE